MIDGNIDWCPNRIVCLTEETTEMLYMLGEEDRIVGISGFTVRPKKARKEKPKVSTFLDAKIEEIVDLRPDLVIGFSDIQANIAQLLIAQGITVWVNNHRTIKETLSMMMQLGVLVDKRSEALSIVQKIQTRMIAIQTTSKTWKERPKVYFEEWYDPLITGICWVAELIEIAGGKNIFPKKGLSSLAKGRIVENAQEVVRKNPDIILASWCGKQFKKEKLVSRKGWSKIAAVETEQIFEIDSSIILQPGPAALTDGLEILHKIIKHWVDAQN